MLGRRSSSPVLLRFDAFLPVLRGRASSRSSSAMTDPLLELVMMSRSVCACHRWDYSRRQGYNRTARLLDLRARAAGENCDRPESLGTLDDHDRSVRDIHSNLDDGCRHENLSFAFDELLHLCLLFDTLHPSVDHTNGKFGKDLLEILEALL